LAKGQVVETENGELVAIDEDRRFYADANSLGITDHKPSKESIDRLVEETKKRYGLFEIRSNPTGRRTPKRNERRNVLVKTVIYLISTKGTKYSTKNSQGM